MLSLEEMSFRNKVLFYEDELVKMHCNGKKWRNIGAKNKVKRWRDIFYSIYIPGASGRRMILTPRAIAVLTGICELDDLDKDRGVAELGEYLNDIKSI